MTETPSLLDLHYDLVADVVQLAARRVRRLYGGPTVEDLAQEGWCWVLAHPGRLRSILGGIVPEEQATVFLARKRLRDGLEEILRGVVVAEHAAGNGYSTRDLVWYRRELVMDLLPAVWDDAYSLAAPNRRKRHDDEAGPADDAPGGRRDPAERGEWQAACLDVQRAWRTLDLPEHVVRAARLIAEGYTRREAAKALHVSASTAHGYYLDAVDALVVALNGGPHVPRWWDQASRGIPRPVRAEFEESA
ncbi:hypothetical protein [Kineococcus terrestris]|uniref:hypothetical protein n=1 Tax=Kineococcus terrestris TaxID=2044856 RepID=UPI0034DAF78A